MAIDSLDCHCFAHNSPSSKDRRFVPADWRASSRRAHTGSQPAGPIVGGRHQEQFAVFVIAISLGEIPDGSLRLVVFASAHDGRTRVFVDEFICPLPHIAHHIHHAVWAGTEGCASTGSGPRIVRPVSGNRHVAPHSKCRPMEIPSSVPAQLSATPTHAAAVFPTIPHTRAHLRAKPTSRAGSPIPWDRLRSSSRARKLIGSCGE